MCKKIFLVLALVCLSLPLLICSGCSLKEAKENLETTQDITAGVTPYVPTTHTYIPAGISVLSTAALGIIKILMERRETRKMKNAIKAKARQIDKIITKTDNPTKEGESALTKVMRADKSASDDETFDNLSRFDAVRKGYV